MREREKIIAIGALGGSGTRALTNLFITAGVYMGDDLNPPNDNLAFTRLLKNPEWYRNATTEEIMERLDLFECYMNPNKLNIKKCINIIKYSMHSQGNKRNRVNRIKTILTTGLAYSRLIHKLIARREQHDLWGWKEPNTQIYIDELMTHFPDLKYIHLIRHGLDMAFSKNQQQLKNWGWKYGIKINPNDSHDEKAFKQLEYWICSTRDVLDTLKKYPGRCLVINHSNLCAEPQRCVEKIIKFCNLDVSEEITKQLFEIPKKTNSDQRYLTYNTNIFSKAQLDYVRNLGFTIKSDNIRDIETEFQKKALAFN